MDKLDKSRLMQNKSIINHNLYQMGKFVKSEHGVIHVEFDCGTILLSEENYQKKWRVVNYDGYRMTGSKILDKSRDFEDSFFKQTVSLIIDEIDQTKKDISDLPELRYDDYGRQKIVAERGLLETKKSALIKMRWDPYFARIDLVNSDNQNAGVSYYIKKIEGIGSHQSSNQTSYIDLDHIVDWRSAEAEPYYEREVYSGEMSENRLVLLRDFEINGGTLGGYQDTYFDDNELIEQVADERLKRHIQANRDKNVKNIIQTIKNNQYRIISQNQNQDLLVNGCAGSGKTMVLAHRLSFWMFRLQDKLSITDAMVISPTKLLSNEITGLDLNINQAKFLTNFEFNKYLYEYACDKLDLDPHLENKYLSNFMLDKSFVKRAYSQQELKELESATALLINNRDDNLKAEFLNYTKIQLNKIFNGIFKRKNPLDLDKQQIYEAVYGELEQYLCQLHSRDLTNYKKRLIKNYDQNLDQMKLISKLKEERKKIRSEYSTVVKELNLSHPEFKRISPKKASLIVEVWHEEIEKLKIELAELLKLIRDLNLKKVQLNEMKNKHAELVELKQRTYFFRRRAVEREIAEWSNKIAVSENQISKAYSPFGLELDFDEGAIMSRANEVNKYIKTELKALYILKSKISEYLEADQKLKEANKIVKASKVDLDRINKHLSLVQALIDSKGIIVQGSRSGGDIESVIEAILNTKLPLRLGAFNYISRFQEFRNSNEYKNIQEYMKSEAAESILIMIVEFVIERYKREHQIGDQHYEFEVFLKLYLISQVKKVAKIDKKWVFIDEFQDYSYSEIQTYRKMFRATSFNLFGDMKQNINAKGLTDSQLEQLGKSKFKFFEITENYRNARQITEYVNKKFNLNMYSIGLEGAVDEGNLETFVKSIDLRFDDSVAVIINNEEQKTNLLNSAVRDYLAFLDDEDLIIHDNKINVLTPVLAKGLEFDTVCVMDDGMMDNEKYVCYTRALKNLFVVH